MAPWAPSKDGLLVAVRVTPRGGRDGFDGIERLADGREVLKLRVRAPPSDGAANQAVCELLAGLLGLPRRDVTLAAGGKARVKTLAIRGAAEALAGRLSKLVETAARAT